MNPDRMAELREAAELRKKREITRLAALAKTSETKPLCELSEDLDTLRLFLDEAVSKIEAGGKSRPRSLAITKLQEAHFWLGKELETKT